MFVAISFQYERPRRGRMFAAVKKRITEFSLFKMLNYIHLDQTCKYFNTNHSEFYEHRTQQRSFFQDWS